MAVLSKLFEGFLDDGPQFVLRLVVVVLFGIGIGQDKDDIIFIMSMITSFGAIVYFGLKFNERTTSVIVKWGLAFPMFAASVASRGFTLSVFLKETLDNKSEWIGGLIVLIIYFIANVVIFKICGQDMVRSLVFGFSSTLIPAGYNNDEYYYQKPHQPLSDHIVYQESQVSPNANNGMEMTATTASQSNQTSNDENNERHKPKMKSGLFLVLHTLVNTALLSSCAIYISATRDLDVESDNALVFPQVRIQLLFY